MRLRTPLWRDVQSRQAEERKAILADALCRRGWALRATARDLGVRASTLQGLIETHALKPSYLRGQNEKR
jgi:lambda repressor-like predicted transcriptional regulator